MKRSCLFLSEWKIGNSDWRIPHRSTQKNRKHNSYKNLIILTIMNVIPALKFSCPMHGVISTVIKKIRQKLTSVLFYLYAIKRMVKNVLRLWYSGIPIVWNIKNVMGVLGKWWQPNTIKKRWAHAITHPMWFQIWRLCTREEEKTKIRIPKFSWPLKMQMLFP